MYIVCPSVHLVAITCDALDLVASGHMQLRQPTNKRRSCPVTQDYFRPWQHQIVAACGAKIRYVIKEMVFKYG